MKLQRSQSRVALTLLTACAGPIAWVVCVLVLIDDPVPSAMAPPANTAIPPVVATSYLAFAGLLGGLWLGWLIAVLLGRKEPAGQDAPASRVDDSAFAHSQHAHDTRATGVHPFGGVQAGPTGMRLPH
jgi:hypothetical protein